MIGKGQKGQVLMIASVFELYGALCFLSLIAFLVLAARAKLRPDLDEDEFDIGEIATGQFVNTLPVEDPALKVLSRSAPPRPVTHGKHLIQKRPHLIRVRKPRTI
jgi:hypothetical protein